MVRRAWTEDQQHTWWLIESLTETSVDPLDVIAEWTRLRPSWLEDAGPHATLAAAELALAYEGQALGRELLLLAAQRGTIERQTLIARAAFTDLTRDRVGARRTLALAGTPTESPSPFVRAVDRLVEEDWDGVHSILDTWSPRNATDLFRRWLIADTALLLAANSDAPIGPLLALSIEPTRSFLERAWRADIAIAQATRLVTLVGLGQSRRPMFHLQEARRLALMARDSRRIWRGETATAVAAACEAAFFAGDVDAVLELGTVHGEATPREAASPLVLAKVAVAMALRGESIDALDLSHLDAFDRERALAHSASQHGGDPEHHWSAAVAASGDDESKRAVALAGLAGTGARVLPNMDYLIQHHPATAAQILAIGELARGEHDQVVERFRGRAGDDLQSATLLAQAYDSAGDTAAAIDVYQQAGRRFADPDLLFNAAILMHKADRAPEAKDLALQILASESAAWPGRARALHFAAQMAAEADDLPAATGFLTSCLDIDPAHTYRRWDLIRLHLARADTTSAWRTFQEHPTLLTPQDLRQAIAWLTLFREEGNAEQLARGAVELTHRFPDDEHLAAKAVASVLLPGPKTDAPLSDDLLAEVQGMIAEYLRRWPEGAIQSIAVDPDDPAAMLTRLHEATQGDSRARAFRRITEGRVARGEMPLGLLSATSSKAYSEILLTRGLGVLPASAPHSSEHALSVTEAYAALGGPCIVDASALVAVLQLPQEDREHLMRAFTACEIIDETLMDVRNGRDSLSTKSTVSIGYDEVEQRSVIHELPEEQAERFAESAVDLLDLALAMPRRRSLLPQSGNAKAAADAGGGSFSPWLPTLQTAGSLGRPLWSDDASLRSLARSMGIGAFGSAALITAAGSRRPEGAEWSVEMHTRLARASVAVPLTESLLHVVADHDLWQPLGAAALLGDATLWANLQHAYTLLNSVASQVAAKSPDSLGGWAFRCARGLSYAYPDVLTAAKAAGTAFAIILRQAKTPSSAVPDLLAAMRAGLSDAAVDPQCVADPLYVSALHLRATMLSEGEAAAAQWISAYFSALDKDDKEIVEASIDAFTQGVDHRRAGG
ncbi:hypothetical protein WDV85_16955 [Pseudokineococcus sp. 5B2Z-1]|uniref:tetratricopeptide repeat protein n=1 Tax=Pseudokineococcus sp. 5B2Z-1 TaxID=3132744 RepID=UPI0030A429C0